jgi:hypothetical protein
VLNRLPNQLADIEGINARRYPFFKHLHKLYDWSFCWGFFNCASEPLRNISSRVHDLCANEARTQRTALRVRLSSSPATTHEAEDARKIAIQRMAIRAVVGFSEPPKYTV